MPNKSAKLRHGIGAFAVALMSCLALGAAGASTASAVSITGSVPNGFQVSGGNFIAKSSEGDSISCKGETTGSGTMEGPAVGLATLQFHNCTPSFGSFNCTSEGAETGTIVTKPLAVELAPISGGEAGIMFTPVSANSIFAAFNCSVVSVDLSGSVIGEITEPGFNQYSSKMSVSFPNESIVETDHGQKAQLTMSVNGSTPSNSVLNGSVSLNFEHEFNLSEEEEADNGHPDLALPGGFPAAVSPTLLVSTVVLRAATDTITCTKAEASGSGEFVDPSSGNLALTLHNCTEELGFKCKSTGQESGTVKTESLPISLTYLSDGTPGTALKANKSSGKVMQMVCGGFIPVVVKGGVLGAISSPELGEAGSEIDTAMNTVKKGEGYVQEYIKTKGGEELSLQVEIAGGKAEPASLDMVPGIGFSEYFLLRK